MEERKGWLTPDQQQIIDDLYQTTGVKEMFDGKVIQLIDDKGGEFIKEKIVAKYGKEILPDIYEIVDLLFDGLKEIVKNKK